MTSQVDSCNDCCGTLYECNLRDIHSSLSLPTRPILITALRLICLVACGIVIGRIA